ncbi:hypothetical protein E2562_011436 [Oryza meyeriana var. granulata]|uniref:Uncharacterized protein n=1 Tax=Oryza meyeriana var. granulata TaxID=110450 RepID=A0A6G1D172_9ORYZ|nr:hypothetical protein E2562_011436 [Oryza meyeriana var. granulata]
MAGEILSSSGWHQNDLVFWMTEAPFVPRERLFKHQQYFRNVPKQTYMKGRYDVITSVAIPLVLAGTSLFLIGRGIYNMSHGIGKKE